MIERLFVAPVTPRDYFRLVNAKASTTLESAKIVQERVEAFALAAHRYGSRRVMS